METTEQTGPGVGTVQGDEWKASEPATKPAMVVTTKKPRRPRVNLALAGVLLAQGMSYAEIAPRVGAATGNSLRVNLHKKGVTARNTEKLPEHEQAQVKVLNKVVTAASEALRDEMGGRLREQIKQLRSEPVTRLASQGQGEAATLKTLAETHKLLFGGSESTVLVFGVDQLCDRSAPEPIEVESSVQTR